MISTTENITVNTKGKGTYEITRDVQRIAKQSGVRSGVATIFIAHTSASLIIYENADPSAREDLHAFFEKIAPENDHSYRHTSEGTDDTTSHLRMALTRTSEVIPIAEGRLALGTWQGIFVFEHRRANHYRNVVVNVLGI